MENQKAENKRLDWIDAARGSIKCFPILNGRTGLFFINNNSPDNIESNSRECSIL